MEVLINTEVATGYWQEMRRLRPGSLSEERRRGLRRCGREGTASVKTVLVFFLNEDVQLEMSRIYL